MELKIAFSFEKSQCLLELNQEGLFIFPEKHGAMQYSKEFHGSTAFQTNQPLLKNDTTQKLYKHFEESVEEIGCMKKKAIQALGKCFLKRR